MTSYVSIGTVLTMRTLRQIPQVAAISGPVSVGALATASGFGPPVSVKDLIGALTVQTFTAVITTPSPDALGGSVELTIRGDGSYDLRVHMHDSGFPDYSFRISILLRSTDQYILALFSNGTAHGTIGSGSRDFDDHQTGVNQTLLANWGAFAAGTLEVYRDYQDNLTAFVSAAFLDILGFVATTALFGGPAAAVVWGGKALGSATGFTLPADLGWPGLILAEGQLVLAGPDFFIPLFIEGVAASAALFNTRPLHPTEITEARNVFLDTVPYDMVTVSNISGVHGQEFAAPGPTGNYLIGAAGFFEDFLLSNAGKHTLIHELTHVWQMENTAFKSYISCDALSELVGEQTIADDYKKYYFYMPGQPWDCYNFEQQAQIVSDWWLFARYNDETTSVITGGYGMLDEVYVDTVIRLGKV